MVFAWGQLKAVLMEQLSAPKWAEQSAPNLGLQSVLR